MALLFRAKALDHRNVVQNSNLQECALAATPTDVFRNSKTSRGDSAQL